VRGKAEQEEMAPITEYQSLIQSALEDVSGIDTFATGGRMSDVGLPVIKVNGVGQLAFPLLPAQAKEIISKSAQAPFGRGADTVVDTSVRLCRQIEAVDVEVDAQWERLVQEHAEAFCAKLGALGQGVEARLYKLVLYEEGGFFKSHKDTEKESGMFGSLVVQLPAQHDEGILKVRHRGQEVCFDFAKQSASHFFASAFYADCEHELLPVKNGMRLCLLYNLVRVGRGKTPRLAVQPEGSRERLAKACDAWVASHTQASGDEKKCEKGPMKLAILLDHEYTETNLSFGNLKGRDLERANLLKQCNQFELHLALITRHKTGSGEMPFHSKWSRWGHYDDDEGPHEMIDCYEDSISVSKFVDATDKSVTLTGLEFDTDKETLDGEPLFHSDDEVDHEDYEGYTGNCGPTLEYWYHRACLVVWPRSFALKMACSRGIDAALALARSRIEGSSGPQESRVETLKEVWKFVKQKDAKSKHLVDLLKMCCAMKDSSSAIEVLEHMDMEDTPGSAPGYYCYGGGGWARLSRGVASDERKLAILGAVLEFGWNDLSTAVMRLVASTPKDSLARLAHLALELKSSNAVGAALGSTAIARRVGERATSVESAASESLVSTHSLKDAGFILKMLFAFADCTRFRKPFVKRVKAFGLDAVCDTMRTLAELYQAGQYCSATDTNTPELFEIIVSDFCEAALAASKETAASNVERAQTVWQLLLGLKYDNLQATFVKGVLKHKSSKVLQALTRLPATVANAGNAHVTALADARVVQLRYARPQPSNRQPHAQVPGHPCVTAFFHGDQKTMTYTGFNGIRHARNFASKHGSYSGGGYNMMEKTSARWIPGGSGAKAFVQIEKTDAAFREIIAEYERDQQELIVLEPLLSAAPSPSEPSAKRCKIGK
jgi:hypothetical protein